MMAAIKGKDTNPELLIRKALFARGYRYRIHDRKLPGKPDLVFRRYNAVIFVNGCFWHGHDCHLFTWPSTRQEFWKNKIQGNIDRDKMNLAACHDLGLRSLVLWECALKGKYRKPLDDVTSQVIRWLESDLTTCIIRGSRKE